MNNMSSRNYKRCSSFHLLSATSKRRRLEDTSENSSLESLSSESNDNSEVDEAEHNSEVGLSNTPQVDNVAVSPNGSPIHPPSLQSYSDSDSVSDSDFIFSDSDSEMESNHESSDEDDVSCIEASLAQWAIKHNITHSALGDLCKLLCNCHKCFASLHIDARTILGTPREKVPLDDVSPGQYLKIGIRVQLEYILPFLPVSANSISLMFNIDGLPLKEGHFAQLWPILMSLPLSPKFKNAVFPVGIYGGPEKPDSLEAFLRPFVDELKDLVTNGFYYRGRSVSVHIFGFCCDSPARAFITATIGPTGYCACSRCTQIGVNIKKGKGDIRVYPDVNWPSRTDLSFRNREDTRFQPNFRSTPLEEIAQIDFGASFILDPMHLLYLGPTKTFIELWLHGKIPHKITAELRERFKDHIARLKSNIPCEFSRKLQGMFHGKTPKMKAKEYRLWLLYVAPVVLREYLSPEKYEHFLTFHVAATILLGVNHCSNAELRNYARHLLIHFVETTIKLYDVSLITLNFHLLIHIVDDADKFCQNIIDFTLDLISAFFFENFLGKLKKLARGSNRSLQQLAKRIGEKTNKKLLGQLYFPSPAPTFSFKSKHFNGPLPVYCKHPQYETVIFPNFTISVANSSDCFCGLENGDIVKAENFAFSREKKEMVLVGRKFIDRRNFYGAPLIESSRLGIFKGTRLSDIKCWKVSLIKIKYIALPVKDSFVLFPLLHCPF